MEAKRYFEILLRRKWIILITMAVVLVITAVGTLLTTPEYMAESVLRISTAYNGDVSTGRADVVYSDRLMNTYSKIAISQPVMNELMGKLNLPKAPQVEVELPANTELMKLKVFDEEPELAQLAANTLSEIVSSRIRELYAGPGEAALKKATDQLSKVQTELEQARREYIDLAGKLPKDSLQLASAQQAVDQKEAAYTQLFDQYQRVSQSEALRANAVSIIEPASLPDEPAKPNKKWNLALSLIVGVIGGLGLALLFENLDNTLYSTKRIEELTQTPIIGRIPWARGWRVGAFFKANSPQEEAIRHLRTNLINPKEGSPHKALLVTSAEPNEGKSTVVANLARLMAQLGRTVLVIDADLRLPTMHKFFNLSNEIGLSDVLMRQKSLPEVVKHSIVPGVFVLASGPSVPNSSELLSSSAMAQLLRQLAQSFDVILIDTPAVMAATDAAALAPAVDGVILVVGRSKAGSEAVRFTRQQLINVRATTVGVVVNGAEQESVHHYYATAGVGARGEG